MNFYELHECVKNLDSFSRPEQIWILEKLAFGYYLRKGFVPAWVAKLQKLAVVMPLSFKFNPYHDDRGRFTFGPDDGSDDNNDTPDNSGGSNKPDSDGTPAPGGTQLVQRVTPDLLLEEPPVTIKPPFEELPQDPTQPPGPGYEWKGNGPPGSPEGSWFKPSTGEYLRPDMDHAPPEGPHWDYRAPDGQLWRWYPDGRMEPKIIAGGQIT